MTAPTILYIHGLEAGPEGRKSAELRRVGFSVIAEQMPCGRRHVARDPIVLASIALSLTTLAVIARRKGPTAALGTTAGLLGLAPVAQALLFRRVLSRSLAIQRAAIARNRIDAIVGSSFGGAVALALLHEGSWSGPTLLLCPAHELVATRARTTVTTLGALSPHVASRVLVAHGTRDETVPLASSERLVRGSAVSLVVVDDDHRLKATATGEQMQTWLETLGLAP